MSDQFISIPVPVSRVQDVYRLLGGTQEDVRPAWEDVFESDDTTEETSGRKAPQCRAQRTVAGERRRCLKGARHHGRHQWTEKE